VNERAFPVRRVAIIGIDNFDRKNRPQLIGLNDRGYVFDVFTADRLGDSATNIPDGNRLIRLAPGFISRTRQLIRYFRDNSAAINHVEVYPRGRYAGMIALLARAFRLPLMTVERGDLQSFGSVDRVTRIAMRTCYRLAGTVWYRQFLRGGQAAQERMIARLGARRSFFLPNAVCVPQASVSLTGREIDFIWVNSLIRERRGDWFVDLFSDAPFNSSRVVVSGLKTPATPRVAAQQQYIAKRAAPNIQLRAWSDPTDLYCSARFFALPSETVYCNNSLLEAMAFGVVPLVSDVEGARLIVDDGIDGIVFEHSFAGFRAAVEKALALSDEEYATLSRNAVKKVRDKFSLDRWIGSLEQEYRRLAGER